MSKLTNLLDNEKKIVEKRRLIFIIPVCFIILAIIMGVVYQFTQGSAFNLGMDFAGGYTINVNVGANLTEENSNEYKERVTNIVEGYTDAEGNSYNIKISQILVSGTGDNTALQVKFKSVTDDDTMEAIVDGIVEKIKEDVTEIRPVVSRSGSTVTVTYNLPIESLKSEITAKVNAISGASGLNFGEQYSKSVTFTYSGSLDDQGLSSAMAIKDTFAATVYTNGKVGATVSQDLLYNALSAIIIALVLMLIYIAIRFEFKSGISAIVALVHDLAVMFAFMVIFHVEFNSTFIAALITILGYSINNSIILFDRVRSNLKIYNNWDANKLANTSIAQSFVRCMNTTITTVIMIGSVAAVCAIASLFNPDLYQMVTFSLPIIVGLLSGLYSAMFVAPSVWVSLGHGKKAPKTKTVTAEANQ
ncbi:MAG: protein translocase subunit SecF [Clostridiales bacterium]|nr:protein translocase subunit SecF [Clostridiales bacterium]